MAKAKKVQTAEDVAREIVFEDSSWHQGEDIEGLSGIDLEALAELISQAIDNAVQEEKMRAAKKKSKK